MPMFRELGGITIRIKIRIWIKIRITFSAGVGVKAPPLLLLDSSSPFLYLRKETVFQPQETP